MDTKQGISFDIRVDDNAFNSSLQRARASMDEFVGDVESGGNKIDASFKKIGASIGAYFAADKLKDFAKSIFEVHSNMQALQTSFETLLGSEERAATLMEEMRTFSVSTPMQLGDLATAAQTMLGFGIAVEDVMPNLKALGDISMGDASKFQSLSLAFSQMSATGKLMGQDLLQMINAGFNPLTEISRKTGKSVGELKEEMSKGAISSEMVAEAFQSATQEGGKFFGMLEKQSKGLRGAFSNLKGAWEEALDSFGEESEGVFSTAIDLATGVVKHLDKIGIALGTAALMWGEYKASVMLVSAAQKAVNESTDAFNKKQVEGIVKQFSGESQATAETNAETAAVDANTAARRENYIATNEQLKALQQKLILDKQSAEAEYQAAVSAEARAFSAVNAAEEQLDAANQAYEAALKSGDGEAIEAAELELATAQQELNSASKKQATATSALKEAQTRKEATATKLDAYNTAVDTAVTQTNSRVKMIWAGVVNKCTAAFKALKAVVASNPLGGIMMLATLAIGAFGLFNSGVEGASEKVEKYGKKAADAISDIERLGIMLQNTGKDTQVHKKLVEELNEVAQEYGVTTVEEIGNLEQENKVREETIAKIKEEAGARQLLNKFQAQKNRAETKEKEIYEQALKDIGTAEYGAPLGNETIQSLSEQGRYKSFGDDIKQLRENKEQVVGILEDTYNEVMENYGNIANVIKEKYPNLPENMVEAMANAEVVRKVHDKVYGILENAFNLDLAQTISTSWHGGEDVIDKYVRANLENESTLKRVSKITEGLLEEEQERTKEKERQAKLDGINLGEGLDNNAKFNAILDDFDTSNIESYQKYLLDVNNTTSELFMETNEVGEAIRAVAEKHIGDLGLPELLTLQERAKTAMETLRASINSVNATPLSIAADTSQLEYVLSLVSRIQGLIGSKFAEGSLGKLKEDRKKLQEEYEKTADDIERNEKKNALLALDKQIEAKDIYAKSKNKGKGGAKGGKKGGGGSKWDAKQAEYDRKEMIEENRKRLEEQTAEIEAANRRMQNSLLVGSSKTLAELDEEFKEAQRKQTEDYKAVIEQQKELDKELWLKSGKDRKAYQYQAKDDSFYEQQLKEGEGALHDWYVAWQKTNELIKADNLKKTADTLDELMAAYNEYGENRRETAKRISTDIANLEKALLSATTDEEKRRIEAAIKFAREQMGALDKELEAKYGSFQQRSKASVEEYDTDIENLQNLIKEATDSGDQGSVDNYIAMLAKAQEERAKALQDFAFKEMQQNINWEQVFGDLERVGTSTLNTLTEQLRQYIETNKELSPENIKTLTDAIRELESETASRDPFKGLSQSVKGFFEGVKGERNAKKQLENLEKTAFGDTTIGEAYLDAITKNDAYKKTQIENTKVTIQVRNAEGELVDQTMTYAEALKLLNKDLENSVRQQTKFQKKCAALGEEFSKFAGWGQDLQGLAETLGVELPDGVDKMIDGVGQLSDALKTLASGDVVGGTIKALTGIVSVGKGIVDTVASIFGGGADYSGYDKALAKYEALKDVWKDIVASKEEYLSMSWGSDAVKAGLDASRVQTQATEALRSLGKEWLKAGTGWFSHSEGVKQIKALSAEARNQLSSAGFSGVLDNKMTSIFDLSAERLKELRESAPLFWAELNEKTREYLEGIIDGEKKLDDLQDQLNERLTGTDFDSFLNGFLDMISDMDSSVTDFSKDFEEKMRKAILNSIMASMYKDKIKNLYESWVNAAKDGQVTAAERDALKDAQAAIVEDMIAERDALNEVFGWSGQSDAEASSRGFATASQDSVDELNGRFAAMQIAMAYGNELSAQSLTSLNGIMETAEQGVSAWSEIRDLILMGNNYLDDILAVSRNIYRDLGNSLNRIALNTNNL